MLRVQEAYAEAFAGFHLLAKPVVAAVNGAAAGAGLALALAADVRLASPSARFNAAFVRIGLTGGDLGFSWALPRTVGLGHASLIMLTGRLVDAAYAYRIGLVNDVVDPEDLLVASLDLADEIAANSPWGIRLTKQVLQANVDAPSLHAAMELENRNQVLATRTLDMQEALAAFREKRPARFLGR
jgi:enoyl-CoA hydratase